MGLIRPSQGKNQEDIIKELNAQIERDDSVVIDRVVSDVFSRPPFTKTATDRDGQRREVMRQYSEIKEQLKANCLSP